MKESDCGRSEQILDLVDKACLENRIKIHTKQLEFVRPVCTFLARPGVSGKWNIYVFYFEITHSIYYYHALVGHADSTCKMHACMQLIF